MLPIKQQIISTLSTTPPPRHSLRLVTQPPKTHTKKGSGNIVYNELSQRNSIIAYVDMLECNINVHIKFAQDY